MRIIDFADGFSSSGAPATASSIYLANGARFGTNTTAAYTSECVTSYVSYASGASRASICSWLDVSTNTPMTHSAAAVGAFLRRIPSESVTDTAVQQAAGMFQVYINSGAGTYTNTSTASGISGIYVAAMAPVGTMAITSYSGIFIAGDSTNTGTNKHGLKINDQTGATNNYAIYTGAGLVRFGDVSLHANGSVAACGIAFASDVDAGFYYNSSNVYGALGGAANSFRFNATEVQLYSAGTSRILVDATGIGFFATTPAAKPTVTGSKGANAALTSLLTGLATLGLVTDSSS